MAQFFLIASDDESWCKETGKDLQSAGHSSSYVLSGKDCQLFVYKNKVDLIIIDFGIQQHSFFEVQKYLAIKHPTVPVIAVFKSKQILSSSGLSADHLRAMGVNQSFTRPFSTSALLKYVAELTKARDWSTLPTETNEQEEVEVTLADSKVTQIKVQDFLSGKVAIFDHYIRLAPNRYKKILHRGEILAQGRIRKYFSAGLEYLYFSTEDRRIYINFMNELTQEYLKKTNSNPVKAINLIENVCDKMIEEVYTQGLKPDLIAESKKLTDNIYQLIHRDHALHQILSSYQDIEPSSHKHLFLVTFFSSLISKNLDWVGAKTRETIALGAFLHDIGMLKLPQGLREMNPEKMNPKQLEIYKEHPRLGAEMLQTIPFITEQVRQIVYQHHESGRGDGFPNSLTGIKIYPLAKIIALADDFGYFLLSQKLGPIPGIKAFLNDRDKLTKHDPALLRALVKSFTHGN